MNKFGSKQAISLFTLLSIAFVCRTARAEELGLDTDKNYDVGTLISVVKDIKKQPKAPICAEKRFVANSVKFVTSYDESGKPCKIYDLSFPTLAGLFKTFSVASVPVQKFKSDDYKAWLHGDYDKVLESAKAGQINPFAAQVSDRDINESWVTQLPFKKGRLQALALNSAGVPASFHLSDVETGPYFKFSQNQKEQLSGLYDDFGAQGIHALSSDETTINTFINTPEKLLSKIRFDWNEVEKVYDVFLEFDFLPIVGPIDLVDYNIQYKGIVERMLRSILLRAFNQIAGYIPSPTARNLTRLALNEGFAFMEGMYDYHANALEDTLRMNLTAQVKSNINTGDVEKGLNLLFVPKMSIVNEYLTAKLQGKSFDFSQLDKKGYLLRYAAEKARNISMDRLNSQLVLKKGCETESLFDYFVICKKNGKPVSVHSLISEQSILIYGLGAPEIYNYSFPAKILVKRLASYLMAAGLQAFHTPIPGFINNQLITILKGIASTGMQDEAFLLNRLTELKRNNGVETETTKLLTKYLFAQNINPFLVKGERLEDKIMKVNYGRLSSKLSHE